MGGGVTRSRNGNNVLMRFGFSTQRGSHNARTIMLEELGILLSYVDNAETPQGKYLTAIITDNCLGKRSGKTRKLSARHLTTLYGLDPRLTIFRALCYFWYRDIDAQPLLALLCSYSRDAILRTSAPFILSISEGDTVTTRDMEEFLEKKFLGSYSKATLKSMARNINSSWTKSGHLTGRVKKIRQKPLATTGAASFALLLGYLTGARGESLFATGYAKLLDTPQDRIIELAETASGRGWITLKKAGDVIEVLFPNNITEAEMELVREQG